MRNLFLILLLILAPANSFADIYKCTANEKTSYQSSPCQADQDEKAVEIINHGYAASAALPANSSIANDSVKIERDAEGKIKRSESAKSDFKKSYPCPANSRRSGSCPGFVIDHIQALACGGADDPSNMQWQTKQAAKAKDKWERVGCRTIKSETQPQKYKRQVLRDSGYSGRSNYNSSRYSSGNSSGQSSHSQVFTGPRGGQYTTTPSGHKSYIRK